MNYSNLMNMGVQNNQPVQNNIPPMNKEQLKSMLPQLDNNALQQLIQQAKMQGIPDFTIQQGIDFLKRL